jgi:hypothetical protein
MLDYIVEGGDACKNIKYSQERTNKETRAAARYMKRCRWLLYFISSPKPRRAIANKLAKKLSEYASAVSKNAAVIGESSAIVECNWSSVIHGTSIVTAEDLTAFNHFRRLVLVAISAAEGMYNATEEITVMAFGLVGVSRDLNAAVEVLSKSSTEFSTELSSFVERLRRIDQLCEEKSNLLNRDI